MTALAGEGLTGDGEGEACDGDDDGPAAGASGVPAGSLSKSVIPGPQHQARYQCGSSAKF